jgi:tetratricopeptide (TPR) repeat protein
MTSPLADLLGKHLQRTHTSVNRLAILSGVPQRTIANWLGGYVHKPHQWQPVVKVAVALHLTDEEANELLRSAGHASLPELHSATREPHDLALLERFQTSPSTSLAAPFQAIADLPTFVGRSIELEELKRALLEGGRARIYELHGMGGVGKTSLAAHLAYQVRDQFPDGVLWARLDTSDSLSILSAFADAYNKDVSEYKDVESRASVVRNLLAGKRALIVLDNAETSAQIRTLLPPTTGKSSVLITTRHDLSVADGWKRITLEPFDTASSETILLFERYLGQEFVQFHRALLMEIAALLGHLPLALAIVAGGLANEILHSSKSSIRKPDSVKALLASLQTASTRLDMLKRDDMAVRASFEISYVSLTRLQQELFSTLGIFSGDDFGADAVAYLTDQTPDQVDAELKNLYSLCLVQESRATRWRLHPLLQDYAREKLESSGRSISVVEKTLGMYRQAVQGGWAFERPLDEEVPNIRFAIDQASHLKLYQPLLETVRVIYPTLSIGAWYSLARTALEQARLAAQSMGDLDAEIFFISSLGCTQHELGDNQNARANFQLAIQLAQSVNRQEAMADIYMNMGKLEIEVGYQKEAKIYFEQSLALARKVGANHIAGKVINNIALILMRESKYTEAEAMYLESLEIVRTFQDVSAMAIALTNLGTVSSLLDNLDRAESYWQEALSLARKANIRISIITLLANIALIQAERGEYIGANQSFEEAIELAQEIHSPRMESAVRSLFGDILRKQQKLDAALEQLNRAKTLADETGDVERKGISQRFLGEVYLERGQLDQADTALIEALNIAKELEQEIMVADTLFIQAKIAFAIGKYAEWEQLAGEVFMIYKRLEDAQRLNILQEWLNTVKNDMQE